ncbi:class E basic helix-loop-helix protein 40 [Lampris incognitus]|uniref:class E basic helix-loop-helix protein 40 n=1 Tax=Lampris incognitus TaxID=2546036 RepID=UPI0024B494EA|nr:class E basic helix-loop-helix protein 40 [Lampris incognitus]
MKTITSAQPPPCMSDPSSLDITDMQGMGFPLYVYKPRRGMKRGDDSKETYKLPHRLIEKKRRDRINECIAQLKDLLPEHLKLTTLGHLEKAVVLELTLKHVKSLSALLEQQQQQIIALQNGDQGDDSTESSEDMFRSGFHLCASNIVQYLASQENSRYLSPSHVINHIQKITADVLQHPVSPRPENPIYKAPEKLDRPAEQPPRASEGHAKNCVPVIQRTHPHGTGEQSGSDTDTDSGYGGEHEKRDPKAYRSGSHTKEDELKYIMSDRMAGAIKQEGNEPKAKKSRFDSTEDETLPRQLAGSSGSYMSFSPSQPPFCMPFYLIPPTAATAAAYLPMLEKCWYPGGMPVLYPNMSASAAGLQPETLPPSLMMSPRAGSPVPHQTPMDSPALLHALKQVPPINLETKD